MHFVFSFQHEIGVAIGDLEQAWYSRCGRWSEPTYLAFIKLVSPWHVYHNQPWLLSAFIDCFHVQFT